MAEIDLPKNREECRELLVLLSVDLLGFIYNLAYPAMLGAFFYECFFHNDRKYSWTESAAKLVLIVAFSLDYVWGRKFYEWMNQKARLSLKIGRGCRLVVIVGVEAAILLALAVAFRSLPGNPGGYLISLALLSGGALIIIAVASRGKSPAGRPARVLGSFTVVCLICGGVTWFLDFQDQTKLLQCALPVLAVHLAYYYSRCRDSDWSGRPLALSGSFAED